MKKFDINLRNWRNDLPSPNQNEPYTELSALVRATETQLSWLKVQSGFEKLDIEWWSRNHSGFPMLREKEPSTETALSSCGTGRVVTVQFFEEHPKTMPPKSFYLGTTEVICLLPDCQKVIEMEAQSGPIIIPCLGDNFAGRTYSQFSDMLLFAFDPGVPQWYFKNASYGDHVLRNLNPKRLYPIGTLPS